VLCIKCVDNFTVQNGFCKLDANQTYSNNNSSNTTNTIINVHPSNDNDSIISFIFDNGIKDFVYITIYCGFILLISIAKKLWRKEVRAMTYLLIFWSMLE
jgi:hypothetical protein